MSINAPMPGTRPGFEALQQQRAQVYRDAENAARYASSFVSFKTHGWGEFLSPEAQYFTTTFVKRPSVAHSFSLDGDELVEGRFPRVTAGVHKWLQDEQGFYTGAWLFFVIETMGLEFQRTLILPQSESDSVGVATVPYPVVPDPMYDIEHDFTFTGIAMKAIPAHLLEG